MCGSPEITREVFIMQVKNQTNQPMYVTAYLWLTYVEHNWVKHILSRIPQSCVLHIFMYLYFLCAFLCESYLQFNINKYVRLVPRERIFPFKTNSHLWDLCVVLTDLQLNMSSFMYSSLFQYSFSPIVNITCFCYPHRKPLFSFSVLNSYFTFSAWFIAMSVYT